VVLGGEFEAELVSSKWRRHRIREVQNKPYPACTATHGHIAATLNLVKGNDIKPEAVEKVHIVCSPRCLEHCAGPGRRRVPENKETADHNSFFLTAVAIVDRQVGLGQFSDAKYSDPGIVRLMEKIEMEASEAFSDTFYGAEVEITTSSGSVYHDRVEFPPGHPSNPMSDTDIEQKFMMLSEPWVDERVAREISEAVWELDSGVSLERLASLLASPVRGSV
jgi:2-methylcitrate dehydratase